MSTRPDGPGGWAAGDAVSPNEYYTGNRLTYQRGRDVETELVDWASGRRARNILLRAFGGGFAFFLFFGTLAAASASYSAFSGGAFAAFGRLFSALAFLVPPAWTALVLFLPRTETLSEWQLLIDGKAQVAPAAYSVIHQALWARRVPARIEPVQRTVNFPERAVRSFLRVTLDRYEVIVSVFPFGWDLYLGWTLRRREIPITVVTRWMRSLVGSTANYSDLIDMEPVRALREAVHNALRRGIEAAADNLSAAPSCG